MTLARNELDLTQHGRISINLRVEKRTLSATNLNLKGVNLFLIGMMGSGKTTTGHALAQSLDYQFFDTDQLIEQLANQSIDEIFTHSGEATFRAFETQVLSELSSYRRLVISTGGGIVLEQMNWSYLRHGLVVWLDVDAETLWDRLQNDDTRPLLKTSNPGETIKQTLKARTSLYEQADVRVKIPKNTTAEEVIEIVLSTIKPKLRTIAEE